MAELRTPEELAPLEAEWEELRRRLVSEGRGLAGPFQAWAWTDVFARLLPAEVGGELRVLVLRRGGELVAVLPMVAERRRLAGLPARVLRSLSDDHSQRWDALVSDEDAAAGLVAHLRTMRTWDCLELRDVPDGHPGGAALLVEEARKAGLTTGRWASQRSPYVPLPDDDPGLDARLDAKLKANLRRRERKLTEELGPVVLERITDPALLAEALDDGFRLEAAGWKGERGTAIACDEPLRRRYGELAQTFLARGQLTLTFLRAGEQRIAFHYAITDEAAGTYYLFKPGFDPRFAKLGPGQLLMRYVSRDLIARGHRELDLLGDDAPWKRDWTELMREHSWWYVFGPSLTSRALGAWKLRLAPWISQLRREHAPARRVGAEGDTP